MNISLSVCYGKVQLSREPFYSLTVRARAAGIDLHPHVIEENWERARQSLLEPFEVRSYRPSTEVSREEIESIVCRDRQRHLTPREMMLFLIDRGEEAIRGDDQAIAMEYTWFDALQKPAHLGCFRYSGQRLHVGAHPADETLRYTANTLILTTDRY